MSEASGSVACRKTSDPWSGVGDPGSGNERSDVRGDPSVESESGSWSGSDVDPWTGPSASHGCDEKTQMTKTEKASLKSGTCWRRNAGDRADVLGIREEPGRPEEPVDPGQAVERIRHQQEGKYSPGLEQKGYLPHEEDHS